MNTYVTYVTDGSTKSYGVPFPFLNRSHVHLYENWTLEDGTFDRELVEGTDFTWVNDTQVELALIWPIGGSFSVVRITPIDGPISDYADGSTLLAEDLDLGDLQVLYAVQEVEERQSAVGGAALTAQQEASQALATANDADAKVDGAVATANNADAKADTAIATATAADSKADTAIADSQTAKTTAESTISIANNAEITANAATTTANAADDKADTALAAVGDVLPVTLVATVADIPSSPAQDEIAEIADSTGIESQPNVNGVPAGFVGDAGLAVRIQWNGSSWDYRSYRPSDPDDRYVTKPLPTASTGQPGIVQLSDSNTSTATDQAATANAVRATKVVADNAQSTADGAVTLAGAAQSTADQGVADAAAAQSTAAAAQSTADSATIQAQQKVDKGGDVMVGNLTVPAICFPSAMGGYRNLFVNGSLSTWQEGPGGTYTSGGYGPDALYIQNWAVGGEVSWERIEGAAAYQPDLMALGAFPDRILRVRNLPGQGEEVSIDLPCENYNLFGGQQVTFSFYAKSRITPPTIRVEVGRRLDTYEQVIVPLETFATSTSWTKYQMTVTLPSFTTYSADQEDTALFFVLWLSGGSQQPSRHGGLPRQDIDFDFGGFQVEYGPTATPLERIGPEQEYLRCCRYKFNYSARITVDQLNYKMYRSFMFPIEMRKTPSYGLTGANRWTVPRLGAHTGTYTLSGVGNKGFINLGRSDATIWMESDNLGQYQNMVWTETAVFRAEF